MREIIRFRVWNPELKEMYILSKKEYLSGTGIYDDSVGHDKSVWMQFTGLHDRNGREIYEGDILEVKDSNGVICRTVVKHIEGAFVIGKWYPQAPTSVEHVIYNGEWEQVEVDIEDHEFLGVVLRHHLEFEIVGNIFEHPHLLDWKDAKE